MSVALASALLGALALYLGLGLLFALVFVSFGAERIDPAAARMPLQARLIILPGVALLWPLMAWKWLRREGPPIE